MTVTKEGINFYLMNKHCTAGSTPACSWGSLGVKGIAEAAGAPGHLVRSGLDAAHVAAGVVLAILSSPAAVS